MMPKNIIKAKEKSIYVWTGRGFACAWAIFLAVFLKKKERVLKRHRKILPPFSVQKISVFEEYALFLKRIP